MPRPPKWRCVAGPEPGATLFKPAGSRARELGVLGLGRDELEALRLVDLEALSQDQVAVRMGVSRSTVSRMATRARRTVTRALVEGWALAIEGGPAAVARPERSSVMGTNANPEGVEMIVAVPHDAGRVNQHFGRTREFLIARASADSMEEQTVFEVPGMQHNHGALAGFLHQQGVDVILAGGMGPPMLRALQDSGFEVICGVSGRADQAVEAYLAGNVEPGQSTCGHHGHGEGGEHAHHHEGGGSGCGGH